MFHFPLRKKKEKKEKNVDKKFVPVYEEENVCRAFLRFVESSISSKTDLTMITKFSTILWFVSILFIIIRTTLKSRKNQNHENSHIF